MLKSRTHVGALVIGVCTDSNAQLPPELIKRFDIEVVPITVIVDGSTISKV